MSSNLESTWGMKFTIPTPAQQKHFDLNVLTTFINSQPSLASEITAFRSMKGKTPPTATEQIMIWDIGIKFFDKLSAKKDWEVSAIFLPKLSEIYHDFNYREDQEKSLLKLSKISLAAHLGGFPR